MAQAIMKRKSVLDIDSETGFSQTLAKRISLVPRSENISKSNCVPEREYIMKKLDSIVDGCLRILIPKSLRTTPPPDRHIYY